MYNSKATFVRNTHFVRLACGIALVVGAWLAAGAPATAEPPTEARIVTQRSSTATFNNPFLEPKDAQPANGSAPNAVPAAGESSVAPAGAPQNAVDAPRDNVLRADVTADVLTSAPAPVQGAAPPDAPAVAAPAGDAHEPAAIDVGAATSQPIAPVTAEVNAASNAPEANAGPTDQPAYPVDTAATAATDAPPSAGDSTGMLPLSLPGGLGGPEKWLSPEGISSAIQMLLMLAVVSLAPAVLLMTTCFVRIIVVLGLLRQALGTQQLPPNQVMTSIALFMTLAVMTPVWSHVYSDAIVPYADREIGLEEAWEAGSKPVRQFMSAQIDRTGNRDDVWLFYKYLPQDTPAPTSYDDVPLNVLLPAFMLSELKTAFLIGFQIYLPFLVLDLVVSSVTISMGMVMLPPVMVSLPLKLLLFVLVDGWHLVVGMLLESFQTFS